MSFTATSTTWPETRGATVEKCSATRASSVPTTECGANRLTSTTPTKPSTMTAATMKGQIGGFVLAFSSAPPVFSPGLASGAEPVERGSCGLSSLMGQFFAKTMRGG